MYIRLDDVARTTVNMQRITSCMYLRLEAHNPQLGCPIVHFMQFLVGGSGKGCMSEHQQSDPLGFSQCSQVCHWCAAD